MNAPENIPVLLWNLARLYVKHRADGNRQAFEKAANLAVEFCQGDLAKASRIARNKQGQRALELAREERSSKSKTVYEVTVYITTLKQKPSRSELSNMYRTLGVRRAGWDWETLVFKVRGGTEEAAEAFARRECEAQDLFVDRVEVKAYT